MTRRILIALLPAVLVPAAEQKRKPAERPPDLEISEFSVRRTTAGVLEVDGRVHNCGQRRIERLKLAFQFISPDGKIVTTQKGEIEESVLEPGEDASFTWQTRSHPRAVYVQISAVNRLGDELVIVKPGPYPIE